MDRAYLFALLMAIFPMSCDQLGIDTEDGKVVARFSSEKIPLLPVGFPVYPKAFSADALGILIDETLAQVTYQGAVDSFAGDVCASILGVSVCLDELLSAADYGLIDDAINTEIPQIQAWAGDQLSGQLRFYNPGPLGVGVSEQISRTVGSVVKFDDIQVTMKVRNRTDELWGVPIRFSLFMGDSSGVMGRTALLKSADADPAEPYTFVVQPGEAASLVLDAPDLVDALNNFRSLSIDYDAVVEVGDLQPDSFQSWLGLGRADNDGNGVADELATWGLVFEELSITVGGRGELDIPVDFPDWMTDLVPE
ncbi:MAG TPA: hypothetical protein ENK18_19400 [Deltaproteobacteria bacterium]|nr:hypothetical protein [Deltaproteobacteria bacterium]